MALSKEFTAELETACEEITIAPVIDEVEQADDTTVEELARDDTGTDAGVEGEAEGTPDDNETEDVQPKAEEVEGDAEGDTGGSESTQSTLPAPVEISDIALTLAAQAGIGVDVARSFGSEEDLLNMVEVLNNAQGDKALEEEAAEPDPLDSLNLDPAVYDETVISTFNAMKQELKNQREELATTKADQATATERADQARYESEQRETATWFESEIQELNKTLGDDTLGVEDYSTIDRGGPQFAAREKLAQQTAVLFAGYEATGQQTPSRSDIVKAAARLVFGDEYKAQADKELGAKLGKRGGQHISRVGGKKSPTNTLDPIDETADMIDRRFFGKT
jgi:hypothetical protein